MANKVRIWKSEELAVFNLVDCTERPLPLKDMVEVRCGKCSDIGTAKFSILRSKMITHGRTWSCKKCVTKENSERGKLFVGEKNGFFGKKHKTETTLEMKKKSRIRWDNTPKETKDALGESIRKSFKEKYGTDNPMNVESIKESHGEIVRSQFQDAEFTKERTKKIKKTNLERYGVEHVLQAIEVKERIKNTNLEKFGTEYASQSPEIKEKITKTSLERYGVKHTLQLPEIKERIKKTNLEKYGSENFFKSEKFFDQKKANNWSTSKAELEILEYIRNLGVECGKARIDSSEIDILAPKEKLGIEYNGLYWHSELRKDPNYHYDKTQKAKQHNIQLIQIFEHEWRDRKEQVKSRLKSLFGKNDVRIGARSCEFKEIDVREAIDFINKYHIQKIGTNITRAVGAYFKNELVLVATFGRHHRNSEKIVLNRFCGKDGVTVNGGLSKISKAASLIFKVDMYSWCDLRWSDGNGYEKAGWIMEERMKPDYFYTDFDNVFSKQSRKKSIVHTPEGITEREHALADGLFRIYDCGKLRFVYKYQQDIKNI